MKKENIYYVLQQHYVWYCMGGDRFKITLCRTDAAREKLVQRAQTPTPGWVAVHMTKTANEMREYIDTWMEEGRVMDESGEVLE